MSTHFQLRVFHYFGVWQGWGIPRQKMIICDMWEGSNISLFGGHTFWYLTLSNLYLCYRKLSWIILSYVYCSQKVTRVLELTCDLINASLKNLQFWSVLINKNSKFSTILILIYIKLIINALVGAHRNLLHETSE